MRCCFYRMINIRTLSFTLALCAALAVHAVLPEKKINRIIEQCDVADTVMHAPDAGQFWLLLQQTDPDYRSAAKSLSGNGDGDIKRNLVHVLADCSDYFANVPVRSDAYDLTESVTALTGIRSISPTASFTVTHEPDKAMFGYPNGYIFMSGGLFDAMRTDTTAVTALMAAECTHYALQHAYTHQCQEKKLKRRTRLGRGALAAVLTVGSILADNSPEGFVSAIGNGAAQIVSGAPIAPRHTLTYTPRQIHQADIVAYRFMQWSTGSGRPYIDALERYGYDIDASIPLAKGYPTLSDRIAVLKALENRQSPLKSRKPKPVKRNFDIFSPSNFK